MVIIQQRAYLFSTIFSICFNYPILFQLLEESSVSEYNNH